MRALTLVLSFFILSPLSSAENLSLQIELEGADTLRITFRNEGTKAESIYLSKNTESFFNYELEIARSVDDSRFRIVNAFSLDSLIPHNQLIKYRTIRIKPRNSYSESYSLSEALSYYLNVIEEEKIQVRSNKGSILHDERIWFPTKSSAEILTHESFEQEDGPYQIQIQWRGIQSNPIQVKEIIFEQGASHNAGKPAS